MKKIIIFDAGQYVIGSPENIFIADKKEKNGVENYLKPFSNKETLYVSVGADGAYTDEKGFKYSTDTATIAIVPLSEIKGKFKPNYDVCKMHDFPDFITSGFDFKMQKLILQDKNGDILTEITGWLL